MTDYDFDTKVIYHSRKPHQCFACLRELPAGQCYISYQGVSGGKFHSMALCVECSYLLCQKTGDHAGHVREGEFSDTKIPNCMRKLRNVFRANPQAAIQQAGLPSEAPASELVQPVSSVVVKSDDLNKPLIFVPARPNWSKANFPRGGTLTLRAGVAGKHRRVKIRLARRVSGRGLIGHPAGDYIGIFVA